MQDKMNILSAQYFQTMLDDSPSSIKTTIDDRDLFIPLDPANTDYQEIMRQVEAGELTIEPADEPPTEGA